MAVLPIPTCGAIPIAPVFYANIKKSLNGF
jgi:hypothetical protein